MFKTSEIAVVHASREEDRKMRENAGESGGPAQAPQGGAASFFIFLSPIFLSWILERV
jgi:hypothetical protein